MNYIYCTRNISNLNGLIKELKSSFVKIEYLLKEGDDQIKIFLNSEIDQQEENSINQFVQDFNDSVQVLRPKIYGIAKEEAKQKHFHNIDYKVELEHGLVPERTISQGEVVKVIWYRSLDQENKPTDPIIKVEIDYTRDTNGFAIFRKTTRTWYNEDGSENQEKKITTKYYFVNSTDMIDEGNKRRKLLVSSVQIPVMKFMIEVLSPSGFSEQAVILKGRDFLDAYDQLFNKFIENSSSITDPSNIDFGKKTIVVALKDQSMNGINSAFNSWLDLAPGSLGGLKTIRQYLVEEFSI